MAGKLTTHALDTALGRGAAGLAVELRRGERSLGRTLLDSGGRGVLLETLEAGAYELVFQAAAYHRSVGAVLSDPPFLDEIHIHFGVADPSAHYHVPLLLSPHSYSTYRGG